VRVVADAKTGPGNRSDAHRRSAGIGAVARSRSARAEVVAVYRRQFTDAASSLWFKPSVAVLGALAMGAALSRIDVQPGSALWPVVFHGDASDARQVLVVVTSTMITVTSLVFALTVVTLQIASTQFSPRLLRRFLRDGGTQLVLSGFVGTVSYSLAGLFTVGTGSTSVPRLGISAALALALMSVALLVYYIGHITNAIRIDTIMRTILADTRRVLRRDHPLVAAADGDPDLAPVTVAPAHAVAVRAATDGYAQGVDARILSLAVRKGLTVQLVPLVGYHVVAGSAVAVVWSDDGTPLKPTTLGAIAALIEIDPERRIELEVGLGVRQLVDITNRAMSTGQNDPYTGAQAVHHLTSLLLDCSKRSFATFTLRDTAGTPRVLVPIMDFPTHLKVVCGHIRQGGLERHPRVMLELLRMLGALAEAVVGEGRVHAVRHETELVIADANRMIPNQGDLDDVLELAKDVLRALDHRDAEEATSVHVGDERLSVDRGA
jgi:uncharacterized membrane protein